MICDRGLVKHATVLWCVGGMGVWVRCFGMFKTRYASGLLRAEDICRERTSRAPAIYRWVTWTPLLCFYRYECLPLEGAQVLLLLEQLQAFSLAGFRLVELLDQDCQVAIDELVPQPHHNVG